MSDKKLLERESLRGLREVWVVIEDIGPKVQRAGLIKNRLRDFVEGKLLESGISVLAEEDAEIPGSPYLYINVNVLETEIGL